MVAKRARTEDANGMQNTLNCYIFLNLVIGFQLFDYAIHSHFSGDEDLISAEGQLNSVSKSSASYA